MTRDALADTLARTVTSQYASLSSNGKPRPRTNGSPQWTVLAGFCLYRSTGDAVEARCVSIGTGLKALPHSKLPIHGDVLHDSHAEIVAKRGLRVWLYQQLKLAIEGDKTSMLEKKSEDSWGLREAWKVGLWISTLPCGDASTYSLSLTSPSDTTTQPSLPPSIENGNSTTELHPSLVEASALGLETSRFSHLTSPSSSFTTSPSPLVHRGRISYSSLSTLRTKPGRADSPPTTSHSCSDKIALWCLLGLQGGLLSQLGVHVVLSFVAVSGVTGLEEEREKIRREIRRAVGGRLEGWLGPRGEVVNVPEVGLAREEFEHARNVVAKKFGVKEEGVVSCQESLSWVDGLGTEVITNGIRQGASPKRKVGEPLGLKSRSRLSKLSLFQLHLETQKSLSLSSLSSTYFEMKQVADSSPFGERYQKLKAAVREGPFKGWLISGKKWESFDGEGRIVETIEKGA